MDGQFFPGQLIQLLGLGYFKPASIVFTDSTSTATDTSTPSFATRAIGTAAATRGVLCGLTCSATATADPTSVEVGGIAFTKLVSQEGTNNTQYAGIYAGRVPTGTTATVDIDWGFTAGRTGISLAAVYDVISLDPSGRIVTSTDDPADLSFAVVAGSVVFGLAVDSISGGGTSFTWTGLTEGNDSVVETNLTWSAATGAFSSAQTPTITADAAATDSIRRAACAVNLR